MKRIIALALVLLMAAGAVFAQSRAVWDSRARQFQIEPGAKIRVGVDNDQFGAAIVELWNRLRPDARGVVEFVNFGAAGGADLVTQNQGEAPDVVFIIDGEVSRNFQSFLTLDKVITDAARSFALDPFYSGANVGNVRKFIPSAWDGMAFAWNITMMEALGLDTRDRNNDGLPDAFDTWEKIFALARQWQTARPTYKGKPVNIVFPMSLEEVWSGFSSLTAGGWRLFAKGDPANPGFDQKEFLAGLEFIKAASDARISAEVNGARTPAASMTWRWDDALNLETAPFFMVGTWMDIKGAETKGGYDIKFGPMPTWKGKRLAPLVKTKGWAINGFTKFPSASHELIRILFIRDGMQAMVDSSSYIPVLRARSTNTPTYDDVNKREMSAAFAFSYPEPTVSLPANPNKRAMDGYYNINLNLELRAVWDGEKTPAQAQQTIVEAYKKWFEANNKAQ